MSNFTYSFIIRISTHRLQWHHLPRPFLNCGLTTCAGPGIYLHLTKADKSVPSEWIVDEVADVLGINSNSASQPHGLYLQTITEDGLESKLILPSVCLQSFPKLFRHLDTSEKFRKTFKSYGLSQSTLEDAYLSIAAQETRDGDDDDGNGDGNGKENGSTSKGIGGAGTSNEAPRKQSQFYALFRFRVLDLFRNRVRLFLGALGIHHHHIHCFLNSYLSLFLSRSCLDHSYRHCPITSHLLHHPQSCIWRWSL